MKELRLRAARHEALRLLRRFGVERESPVPVEDVAHALGVQIVRGELKRALASLTRAGRQVRIRVSDGHVDPGQLRFSIAHELGHYVLRHRSSLNVCDEAAIQRYFFDGDAEAEANAFAGELLLPEPQVRRRCEVSPVDLDVVDAIARDFGTSIVAAAIRFAELTSERCAVVFAQEGCVRWVVRSPTFWPVILRGQPLLPWSIAHGYFAGGEVSRACEPVDATAWVDSHRVARDVEIFEHARVLDHVAAVLSIVWIPEPCGALAHRVA